MSVFKSFSLMSILTFLSRILGYARDLLFAFIFGASSSADSFLLAFRLPNLFRRLFGDDIASMNDKVLRCIEAAKLAGSIILLKGADTVIASHDGNVVINSSEAPYLATAVAA